MVSMRWPLANAVSAAIAVVLRALNMTADQRHGLHHVATGRPRIRLAAA